MFTFDEKKYLYNLLKGLTDPRAVSIREAVWECLSDARAAQVDPERFKQETGEDPNHPSLKSA